MDRTGFLQKQKAAVLRSGSVTSIAPSEWMAEMSVGSGKVNVRPLVVGNGVDTGTFRPAGDRDALKSALGLPLGRPLVLISAGPLMDTRKGALRAINVMRAIADLDPFAVIVGRSDASVDEAFGTVEHRATGYIRDSADLARWYAAADVFLFCSSADNQPLSILETMACGTPTVGFAVGGVPEMIEQGVTGFLVPSENQRELADALRASLRPDVSQTWGEAARRRAVERHSMERFIDRHESLYIAAAPHRFSNASGGSWESAAGGGNG